MQQNQMECIGYSEINTQAISTYQSNFSPSPQENLGDITKLDPNNIPEYDLLTAGFPCQSFSVMGRLRGFADTRGTLFFDLARIIRETRPRWFILENVPGILSHDNGKTFQIILDTLGCCHNGQPQLIPSENHLGYTVYYQILNALDYGLLQSRKRVFIVGYRDPQDAFRFPLSELNHHKMCDLLEKTNIDPYVFLTATEVENYHRYSLKSDFAGKLLDHVPIVASTILSLYDKTTGNSMKFMDPIHNRYRLFTPRECARLQGFPDWFRIHPDIRQAYQQIGYSVPVPIVSKIIRNLLTMKVV